MTAGSATISMHEACCHATSDHAINFCINRSTNTQETLTGFRNHFRLHLPKIRVHLFIICISESNGSTQMCSSSAEYELDLPAGRSCETEPEGSEELFELEAERSIRCSDLNPFSKQ